MSTIGESTGFKYFRIVFLYVVGTIFLFSTLANPSVYKIARSESAAVTPTPTPVVISVQTEGNGDIYPLDTNALHNHNGAMVWDGAKWVVNQTWAHKFFVDVRTGLRLKPVGFIDVNQTGTFGDYQFTRNTYAYSIAGRTGDSFNYQAVEYFVVNFTTGKKVILRSRGSGNNLALPFFNIYIEDELNSGLTQTTAFRGDPAWFTYAMPADQAVDQIGSSDGYTGNLPSVSVVDWELFHSGGYFLDIGGGADLGPAGIGKSYHFRTYTINSLVSDLGSTFPKDFELRYMDSTGNVWGLRFLPEIISETHIPAPVVVSGRVMTPEGSGVKSARVNMINPSGEVQSVLTNTFGFYSFGQVVPGMTYRIAVISKRYRFASQNIEINGSLSNVDFVGLE